MTREIVDCEQNTPEWHAARCGIATASELSTIMAKGRGGEPSKTRLTYMRKLAGEIITEQQSEGYSNAHMERGHAMEAEALAAYEIVSGIETEQCGFIRAGRFGASPDRIVRRQGAGALGIVGLVEIKTKLPHLLIECIERKTFPPEHVKQAQGQMMAADAEWCDIAVYWPGMPLFQARLERDRKAEVEIEMALATFNAELDSLVARVRGYGGADA